MQKRVTLNLSGRASGQSRSFELTIDELKQSLMRFLHNKEIPIASSCDGAGVCQKCVVRLEGKQILSCQFDEGDWPPLADKLNIEVDYL